MLRHRAAARMVSTSVLACVAMVAARDAAAQHWLDAARYFSAADGGRFCAVGDVDLDQDADVLFASDAGALRIFFGDGTGDLQPGAPLPATTLALPLEVLIDGGVRPMLGDVTGDGRLDVIAETIGAGNARGVSVFPGAAGGTFGAPVFTAAGGDPRLAALGDANGDQVADVALVVRANGTDSVAWCIWQGGPAGALVLGASQLLLANASGGAFWLAPFDRDGDGDDDLALGTVDAQIEVVATIAGAPGASVTANVALPAPGRTVDAADLDGDGDDDLVVSTLNGDGFLVVLANDGAGNLLPGAVQTFADLGTNATIGQPYLPVDWEGDGDRDLLITLHFTTVPGGGGFGQMFLLENDGANAFTRRGPALVHRAGTAGAADFDGDGFVDGCGQRAIVFGDGSFDVVPPRTGLGTGGFPRDLDDDGDVDAAVTQAARLVNDATGTLASQSTPFPPAPLPMHSFGATVALGDFDGDGTPDRIVDLNELMTGQPSVVFREVRLLRGTVAGGLVDAGPAAPPGASIAASHFPTNASSLPATADVDLDGDLDLLADGGFWRNGGAGFFAQQIAAYSGHPVHAADMELDGDVDVLTTSSFFGQDLSLARNGGAGTFIQVLFGIQVRGRHGRFVDFDGDGDLDALAPAVLGPPAIVLIESTNGAFVTAPVSVPAGTTVPELLFADDVDGDGLRDLVSAPRDFAVTPLTWVLPRTGPGPAYGAARAFATATCSGAADADGDGDLDLIGETLVKNRAFAGATAGAIRQYGAGTPGTAGAVPLLGAVGPMRVGSASSALRLRNARGGALCVLFVGPGETALQGIPGPGLRLLVDQPLPPFVFNVAGAANIGGAGQVDLPFAIPPAFSAQAAFFQAFFADPAGPAGAVQSNGLELRFF